MTDQAAKNVEPSKGGDGKPNNITFEVFVKNPILKIQKEAWGRGKEVTEIRTACQEYLDSIQDGACSVPFDEKGAKAVLHPLKLACSCSIARVVEPALGCVHKLVSSAWITAESTSIGNLDDGSLVGEIISMVVKCVDLGHAGVYLAVVKALLTFATAEHFVSHGQGLLFMVRSVFNLAVSCDDTDLKRAACNSLLQMLNTIIKRVTIMQFQLRLQKSVDSAMSPKTPMGDDRLARIQETGNDSPKSKEPLEGSESPAPGSEHRAPVLYSTEEGEVPTTSALTAELASLAEKEDIEGLEAALEKAEQSRNMDEQPVIKASEESKDSEEIHAESSDAQVASTSGSMVRSNTAGKEGRRPKGWDNLSVLEKDVLVVLTAFCKLAGMTPASGPTEDYYRQGKLLALELLVKVFENSGHKWDNVRLEFCEQLRLPLCLVLVRNCSPSEAKAFQFAVRLFCAIMLQPQLRLGLKAELGALYPLLLMRPLESRPLDPGLLFVALSSVKRQCREPQMQVDLFINFDCDLQAANLYERTAKALSLLAVYGDPNAPPGQSSRVRDAAIACTVAMLNSLDAWAGPIREAAAFTEFSSRGLQMANGPFSNGLHTSQPSEVKHFSESKAQKNSLSLGLEVFNKNPLKGIASLVASNVVENKPEALGAFLRKHRDELDETMMGEYLGHHDDMPIAVMHAYIDMEQYLGLTIDEALRKLLAGFRIPGEAQKIDRIMEKFAGRYCQDNPGVFKSADDAYVLAFAIIMLNTDAHNPMAEQKLMKEDFVDMNCRAAEPGVHVLTPEKLEAIFDRITANEIRTRTLTTGSRKEEAVAVHKRLASAVGLSQMTLPFRPGVTWSKERGVQLEHRKLIELTRKAMKHGALGGDVWFTASHTEHSRPMLEAAGPAFLQTLAAALECAGDAESAKRVVDCLKLGIKLAALLGCDNLCQQMVGTLANATGVKSREALLRANPHCQILALQGLISVASDEHAGLLGSSWTIILRTISSVEALVSELRRAPNYRTSDKKAQSLTSFGGRVDGGTPTNAFGRFLSQIGLSSSGRVPSDGFADGFAGRGDGTIRAAAGGALRAWSDAEGTAEMDKVFVGSNELDGDAVLVFTRALCAVSLEELNPEEGVPRVFSLRKLVECAYYNLDRIRLVWSRLWSAISAHLVNASCHPDQTVAMYAVDSLRQLVGKLLARAELATFTTQGDTLRPFVMVLKHCSSVVVRELTVQCIDQAMTAHSRRLGSGWVQVLEALSVAATDAASSVVQQCLDTLQLVVNTHWKRWGKGRDVLTECIKSAHNCARNPHHLDSSLRAVRLLKSCATELYSDPSSAEDVLVVVRSASLQLADLNEHFEAPISRRECNRTASASNAISPVDTDEDDASFLEGPPAMRQLWAAIFEALADIVTKDERRRCADLAADVLYSLVDDEYSTMWELETWKAYVEHAVRGVFDVLQDLYMVPGGVDRVLTYSQNYLPLLWKALGRQYKRVGTLLLPRFLDLLVVWMKHPLQAVAIAGVQLLKFLIECVAEALDGPGWGVVIGMLKEAWKVCTCSGDAKSPLSEDAPFKAWLDGPLQLAALRSRCQVLIAFQRYLDELHRSYAHLIPPQLQLELIDILLETVHQAGQANRDAKFLTALGTHVNTAPIRPPSALRQHSLDLTPSATATPLSPALDTSDVQETTPGGSPVEVTDDQNAEAMDYEVVEAPTEDSAVGMEQNVGGSGEDLATEESQDRNELGDENVDPPGAADSHDSDRGQSAEGEKEISAEEMVASVGAQDGVAEVSSASGAKDQADGDGMADTEGEAWSPSSSGKAILAEFEDQQVRIDCGQGSNIEWPLLVMDVEEGVGSLFHGLLRVEAEGGALAIGALLRSLPEKTTENCENRETSQTRLLQFCRELIKQAAEETQSTSGSPPSKDLYSLTVPLQPRWDQAVRAPVITMALDAYRNLDGELLAGELRDLFPHLSKLIACQQPSVRQALASLLRNRLPPILFPEDVN
ncbi:hypothetical protein BSKO_07758 [Bryopsis sp. KO-2023]|nr:hypothetical protein BSKO_07758 [Bryopsis sp. KO-2023]